MAKAKSKKITMEDALVPVEEQPYEVPENWCWIHLLDAFDNVTDSKKKLPTKEYQEEGEYSIIDQGQEFVGGYTNCKDMVYDGDMPVIIFGDHTRCVKYVDFPFVQGADGVKVLSPKKFWDSKAFYYAIQSVEIPNMGYRRHYPLFKNFSIPVPPLPEQQRIVEQIESLFSKLDEAMEKAQEALDSFEERRVAILHKAFEGELTLQWRAEHGVDMSSWRDVPLKDCGRWFGGGTPTTSKKEYWEGGDIPWITSKDMKDRIIEDSLMHITMTGVENSSANYCEEPAVLFVMRSGILRRVFPVCMVKRPFTVNQDLKACVPDGILQEYLYWYCTGFEKDIRDNCMKSGTTVESVEAKKLFDYSIRVAGADEQKEIVNRIEAMLDKEAAAYEAAEEVIENIEAVKKSILAKAFRGELGTTDASEESSIKLLKQILEKG